MITLEQRVMAKKVKDIIGMYFHPLPHWKPEDWYDHEAIAAELLEILNAHTTEDERYQTALEVQAEYLKELNKYSKEKSWEEGQSQSGLFMWLGMKLQQEDKC